MNRTEILQKLAAGEITVDEATRLLKEAANTPSESEIPEASAEPEMAETPETEASPNEGNVKVKVSPTGAKKKARYLKIRVENSVTEREYVKVNIPLSVINAGMLFGARLTNRISAEAWNDVVAAFERGEIDTLVEVGDTRDGERVRIYIE